MSRNLLGFRRDLLSLSRAVQRLAASQRRLELRVGKRGGAAAMKRSSKRPRRLTPADRARLKVQGEYLGLVRHLSAKSRSRVKALKAEKGYLPALKLARQLRKGR